MAHYHAAARVGQGDAEDGCTAAELARVRLPAREIIEGSTLENRAQRFRTRRFSYDVCVGQLEALVRRNSDLDGTHETSFPTAARTPAIADSIAFALFSVSSHSRSAIESATIP